LPKAFGVDLVMLLSVIAGDLQRFAETSMLTQRMPLQYAEKINAARSGMARAAAAGRDDSGSEQ
jgi:hypothetical protein